MFDKTAALYDLFYDWKDYAAEAAKLHAIIADRNPRAGTLLDVACGTGRHLEHLRNRYVVEGLDLNEGLLAVAAERLPGIPLHAGDMRDFSLGQTFDVVTCLFSSIGYVRTVADLQRAVAAMRAHLAPSGVLIVEPWFSGGVRPTPRGAPDRGRAPRPQAVRMNGSRVHGTLSIIDFHYLVSRPGTIEHLTETHVLGLFTRGEYRSAFERAGLAVEYEDEGLMGRGLWIATA